MSRLHEQGRLNAERLSAAQQNMAKLEQETQMLEAGDTAQKRLGTTLNQVVLLEAQAKAVQREQKQILGKLQVCGAGQRAAAAAGRGAAGQQCGAGRAGGRVAAISGAAQ